MDRDIEETVDMLFDGYPDPERPPGDFPPPTTPQEARHLARRRTLENRRARWAAAIKAGRHPLNGEPLLARMTCPACRQLGGECPEGCWCDCHKGSAHTCGDCAHRVLKRLSRTYPKCDLGPVTGGPATDVQARWPACVRWEPK